MQIIKNPWLFQIMSSYNVLHSFIIGYHLLSFAITTVGKYLEQTKLNLDGQNVKFPYDVNHFWVIEYLYLTNIATTSVSDVNRHSN